MSFFRHFISKDSKKLEPLQFLAASTGSATNAIPSISGLDLPASSADIERLFRVLLNRRVDDQKYRFGKAQSRIRIIDLIRELTNTPEFFNQALLRAMPGSEFRIPSDFVFSGTHPKKVLLIGSCAFDTLYEHITKKYVGTVFEKVTFNNGSILPERSAQSLNEIDFQIIQLPIRALMPEHMYMDGLVSEDQAVAWFQVSKSLLKLNYEAASKYNAKQGLQTFVFNFLSPQQNPNGRLQDPYCFRNPIYYINELNKELYSILSKAMNTYFIDADQISSSLGKRYIQDDSVSHINHGSMLSTMKAKVDDDRIESVGEVDDIYFPRIVDFSFSLYEEVLSARRSISQVGAIKLVVFDLDDTLWRGVAAESLDNLDIEMTEGWPLGVLEAASRRTRSCKLFT